MTSFVQKKILVDPNHQEFAMKQTHKKDIRIVTFDLIGLLPTSHINSYFTMNGVLEFMRKPLMLTVE